MKNEHVSEHALCLVEAMFMEFKKGLSEPERTYYMWKYLRRNLTPPDYDAYIEWLKLVKDGQQLWIY